MSFVSVNQKEIQRVLGICNQISPKRSDIDIFTYTKLLIQDGKIYFTAINPNLFFSHSLNTGDISPHSEPIQFLIKTDIFFNSISLISDEMVGLDINLEKTTLIVQGSKTKHTLRLNTQSVQDFVVPTEDENLIRSEVTVNVTEINDALRVALTTVGQPKNVYQPEFLSVCLSLKPAEKQFIIVSSDRYRISKTVLVAAYGKTSEDLTESTTNFLLNPKSLQLLVASSSSEDSLQLNFEQDYLWAKFGTSILTLRYGEGKYPDYEKIIPQSFTCSFVVNTKDTLDALKQAYLSARANAVNKSVSLTINPQSKKITLIAKTDEGYASESVIDIENYEGVDEPWTQAFNAEYLMDYVSNVNSQNLLWESNPGKPLVLSPENERERQICLVSGLK